jgi:hypothetical protein
MNSIVIFEILLPNSIRTPGRIDFHYNQSKSEDPQKIRKTQLIHLSFTSKMEVKPKSLLETFPSI